MANCAELFKNPEPNIPPCPSEPKTRRPSWETDCDYHLGLFDNDSKARRRADSAYLEETKTTPVFSGELLESALYGELDGRVSFPQYGLLAKRLATFDAGDLNHDNEHKLTEKQKASIRDERLFLNINAPWSAFICGSQGSGKSHTLSCIIESGSDAFRPW